MIEVDACLSIFPGEQDTIEGEEKIRQRCKSSLIMFISKLPHRQSAGKQKVIMDKYMKMLKGWMKNGIVL